MTIPGRGQVWTGEQLTARLIALHGVAPEVAQYAVARVTEDADQPGQVREGYLVPGEVQRLNAAAFDFWLAKRGLAGPERLSVAVLVVRELVAANGDILWCTLEHRRGGMDGPYHGSPARIVFTGPVQLVHFYQATPDGQMTEIAPAPDMAERTEPERDAMTPLQAALSISFGDAARVVNTRAPTVIEAMVGLTSVLHIARPDGREVGCGILWHGPIAVVLQAAFARFDVPPEVSPRQSAALDALLAAHGLSACEVRRDEFGSAVLARRKGGTELFLVRFDGEVPRLLPYSAGRPSAITAAQEQWLHYIETYEGLTVLDAYHDGKSEALIVLTAGPEYKVWRHSVDGDGVETWRVADTGSDVAALCRERQRTDVTPAQAATEADADAAPFGHEVEARFPAAAYDIDEASRCLALGRSTAVVFHCMRIIEQGLQAYASWRGKEGQPEPGERRWRVLLIWVRAEPRAADLNAKLDAVRRAWRGGRLQVAAKYTEAEAARILGRVDSFMRCLARLCDEDGEPVDDARDDAV